MPSSSVVRTPAFINVFSNPNALPFIYFRRRIRLTCHALCSADLPRPLGYNESIAQAKMILGFYNELPSTQMPTTNITQLDMLIIHWPVNCGPCAVACKYSYRLLVHLSSTNHNCHMVLWGSLPRALARALSLSLFMYMCVRVCACNGSHNHSLPSLRPTISTLTILRLTHHTPLTHRTTVCSMAT